MSCVGCGQSKPKLAKIEWIDINFIRDSIIKRLMELEGKAGKVKINNDIVKILRPCCWQDILMIAQSSNIEVEII